MVLPWLLMVNPSVYVQHYLVWLVQLGKWRVFSVIGPDGDVVGASRSFQLTNLQRLQIIQVLTNLNGKFVVMRSMFNMPFYKKLLKLRQKEKELNICQELASMISPITMPCRA